MLERDQFIELFEAAVNGVPKGSLRPDTAYKTLPEWDSLAVLTVVDSVDEACGVLLKKTDFAQSQTLNDLYTRVAEYLNP
jgi:acyl carrier protein